MLVSARESRTTTSGILVSIGVDFVGGRKLGLLFAGSSKQFMRKSDGRRRLLTCVAMLVRAFLPVLPARSKIIDEDWTKRLRA